MNAITKFAAAAVIAVAGATGAQAATLVTLPFFFDTNTFDFVSGDNSASEDYEVTQFASFDLNFSGTGLATESGKFSYSVDSLSGTIVSGIIGDNGSSPLMSLNSAPITFFTGE